MFGTICELILNNAFYPKTERVYSNPVGKDGNPELSIVDNSGSADCFLNEHGYIANDFSLFMKAENENQREAIMRRLVEVSTLPDNSSKSLDQIFGEIVPRGMRDPVDYERMVDNILDPQFREAYAKLQLEQKEKISFKNDEDVINNV